MWTRSVVAGSCAPSAAGRRQDPAASVSSQRAVCRGAEVRAAGLWENGRSMGIFPVASMARVGARAHPRLSGRPSRRGSDRYLLGKTRQRGRASRRLAANGEAASPCPEHRNAASSTPGGSERQVVVLILERPRKIGELLVVARRADRLLRAFRRPGATAACVPIAHVGAASAAAQHDHLPHVDLGAVAGLALLVLPLPVLDPAFDVELVALLHVLLDDVG